MSPNKTVFFKHPLLTTFTLFPFTNQINLCNISGPGIQDAISRSVLEEINLSVVFRDLRSHMMDNSVNDNHVYGLIKSITKMYSKVRMYHLGREQTQKISGEKIRKKYVKLIHFKNQ